MGNSLESSVSLFEEWDGLAETIEMGEICEDIEEYLEPLQRGEVVSSLASGIKSVRPN